MRGLLLFGVFAIAAAGCSDPVGAPFVQPFDVELSYSQVRMTYVEARGRWECTYTVRATATGTGNGVAPWQSGDLQFWYTDGSTYTIDYGATEVLDFWGSDRIRSGTFEAASRFAYSAEAFNVSHTFRLEFPDGSRVNRTVWVPCWG